MTGIKSDKLPMWLMMSTSEIYLPTIRRALQHYIEMTLEPRGRDNIRCSTRNTVIVEDMLKAIDEFRECAKNEIFTIRR